MAKLNVQLGQRFGSDIGSVWEVQLKSNLKKAPKHVVIVNVNDRTTSKLIAEWALLQPDIFQPARKAPMD